PSRLVPSTTLFRSWCSGPGTHTGSHTQKEVGALPYVAIALTTAVFPLVETASSGRRESPSRGSATIWGRGSSSEPRAKEAGTAAIGRATTGARSAADSAVLRHDDTPP